MNDDFFEHPILDDQEMADLKIQSGSKIQSGDYPGTVIEAKKMTARSSGNKMLMLKIQLFSDSSKVHIMTCFLVSTPSMAYKIKHFWESAGQPERYNSKNKVSDYLNKNIYCRVAPQKNKQKGLIENCIVDFIIKEEEKHLSSNSDASVKDDDIPF